MYGLKDLYNLLEIILIDAQNQRRINKAVMEENARRH